jgi:hypothetical protein
MKKGKPVIIQMTQGDYKEKKRKRENDLKTVQVFELPETRN